MSVVAIYSCCTIFIEPRRGGGGRLTNNNAAVLLRNPCLGRLRVCSRGESGKLPKQCPAEAIISDG